ncbi:MAG: L,D-transpeptidase family protein [Mangrovicoccus sp.]|nr:L,D-transpeptidase family protein [Mangrovicoccus sp.]
MLTRGKLAILLLVLVLAGCAGGNTKFKPYDGPEVTQVFISKERRKLYLLHEEEVLKEYKVALGFEPDGHKGEFGDGRTPEGLYFIDRHNPNSAFHLSLGISYPNSNDRLRAAQRGVQPGGDIFIHGQPNNGKKFGKGPDWTAGCIAVKNDEIEEIFAMVRKGTPIYIKP